MNKLLVDTNILIYGIDKDSQFFDRSRQILEHSKCQLITTSKNLTEFLAVVTRSSGYDLDVKLGLEILKEVIQNFEIIYPSHDSLAIFFELMNRYKPRGLKMHDFEILSIGLAAGIHDIATFNVKDFRAVKEIFLLDL